MTTLGLNLSPSGSYHVPRSHDSFNDLSKKLENNIIQQRKRYISYIFIKMNGNAFTHILLCGRN